MFKGSKCSGPLNNKRGVIMELNFKDSKQLVLQGNEACAKGAIYAGCRFFAGYPITPSTEIIELLSSDLQKVGGAFIQMEDEIASACAIIGARWGGKKAMTATSGPGYTLMQEAIGYAAVTETPVVIVNVQRGGPSTCLLYTSDAADEEDSVDLGG